jgi:hypothetical protein
LGDLEPRNQPLARKALVYDADQLEAIASAEGENACGCGCGCGQAMSKSIAV